MIFHNKNARITFGFRLTFNIIIIKNIIAKLMCFDYILMFALTLAIDHRLKYFASESLSIV